jgi:hypothetical protein
MTDRRPEVPEALEIGFIATAALLGVGLLILFGGRIFGGVRRANRQDEGPPTSGSVPNERHRNTGAVSAR